MSSKASAAYEPGRIIDDNVFLDATSMDINAIQGFLVNKGSGLASMNFSIDCDQAGQTAKQAYLALGAPCGQARPASHIIYYAAQVYGISPKVILATMQKEQSLTTATNPTSWQLERAMGYGCPTSGGCQGASTFFYQIDNGSWVLRFHYERARGNMNWWYTSSSWTCGTEKNFYKPNLYPGQNVNFYDESGNQYTTIYINNAATSSMYCYTPHAYNNPLGLYGRTPYGTTGSYYSGSYNFVLFFEAWFGPTQGQPFAWQVVANNVYDINKSASIDPSKLKSGERVKISLKVKNTGTEIWYKNGPNPITLATVQPNNRKSSICDPTWLSCNRIALPIEEVISPGGEGHFEFILTVPQGLGEYREYLAPVLEGRSWMYNDTGYHVYLKSNSQYAWDWASYGAWSDPARTQPIDVTNLSKGQYFYVAMYAKNSSATTWTNTSPYPVGLGTYNPTDRHSLLCSYPWIPSCNRAALMNEAQVLPGQTASFSFLARAPYDIGEYREYFKPVAEYNAWMQDNSNHMYIKVTH